MVFVAAKYDAFFVRKFAKCRLKYASMLCSVLHQVRVSLPITHWRWPMRRTNQLLMPTTASEKRASPVSSQYKPNASATQAAVPEYEVLTDNT